MSFIKPPKKMVRQDPNVLIDAKWPLIIQAISANHRVGNSVLYKQFGHGIKSLSAFNNLCAERGIADLRKVMKSPAMSPKKSSIQLTEDALEKFKAERETKGILFLGRMGEMVDQNMRTLERQAARIEDGDDDLVDGLLPTHLDNLGKVQKLGAAVYGLDKEASVEDQQKLQLQIIMNYNPLEALKQAQGRVIDQDQ